MTLYMSLETKQYEIYTATLNEKRPLNAKLPRRVAMKTALCFFFIFLTAFYIFHNSFELFCRCIYLSMIFKRSGVIIVFLSKFR